MREINPPELAAPIAAYSHGTEVGNLVFVAGQVPVDKDGNLVGDGDVAAQTRQVIANVEAVLRAAGASLADVVSTTVYVRDFDRYAEYNEAYSESFGANKPARATVQAGLVRDEWLVEIQAIAVKQAG
jgi:2-iminobutanoate/2-iminopropanoate deaminase